MWDDLTSRPMWRGSEWSRYQEITVGSAGRSRGCGHFGANKAADSEEMQKTRRVTETDQDREMMRVCGKRRNGSLGTQMVWPVQRTARRPLPGCFRSVASACGRCRHVCTEACARPQGRAPALADQHPVCPGVGSCVNARQRSPRVEQHWCSRGESAHTKGHVPCGSLCANVQDRHTHRDKVDSWWPGAGGAGGNRGAFLFETLKFPKIDCGSVCTCLRIYCKTLNCRP